jgi:tetratricopeptide (TPR) repeat protein
MKIIKFLIFSVPIILALIGLICRILYLDWSNAFLFFGLFLISVYYTIKIINDIIKKSSLLIITQQASLILLSFVLISKYLDLKIADYPAFVIVPLFICCSVLSIKENGLSDKNIVITTIVYLLYLIPILGLNIGNSPRELIPSEWYNRYNVGEGVKVKIPYGFKYKETEELSKRAFDLRKSNNYYPAIAFYQNALKLEPKNPRLYFDQAECYARINELEIAICKLDTAISIDSTWAGFFNNRGLLYYKLGKPQKAINDYQKALSVDSTQLSIYANLALAFYDIKDIENSFEAIKKARYFDNDDHTKRLLNHIKREYRKKYSH